MATRSLSALSSALEAYWILGRVRFTPALHKLEQQGAVESYEGVENGRTRRYYRITKSGRVVLARDRGEWRELSRVVTFMLKEI